MSTYQTRFERSAIGAAVFILYVMVGGAALTSVLSGSVASHAVESTGLIGPASRGQIEPISTTPVVVGITIADAYCQGPCLDSFDILCTTSKERISADWIVVAAADFPHMYRELGCQARAE